MVIAMITAGAVQMAGDKIVDMIAMGYGFVPAFWSVLVLLIMPLAGVIRGAY
jgi:hypothetical protein